MVLEKARQLGLLVVFLRNAHSRDGKYAAPRRLRLAEKRVDTRGEYETEGTWGNEVLEELEPRPNEPQIMKYRSSGFFGTPLDIVLKSKGIKAAVAVGLATDGCVEATVRDLEQYGYYPVVLKDCVWSPQGQNHHKAALLFMMSHYDVITSARLLQIWHSATGRKA